MKILLSPSRMDEALHAEVIGDTIKLNQEVLDFSLLTTGGVLPREAVNNPWVASDIRRIDGEIHLTLILPHGDNAPRETRFPSSFNVPMTVMNGPVPLPPYDSPPVVDDVQLPELEPEVTP